MTHTDIRNQLACEGYALLREYDPHRSTAEVTASFGEALRLSDFDAVQVLTLREQGDSTPNTYSGNYGKREFPLHSDLAHWVLPPRYLLLRCVTGVAGVMTRLLDSRDLISAIGALPLTRTLVQPRRPLAGRRSLLRLLDSRDGRGRFFRWDSLFVEPATPTSEETFEAVAQYLRTATAAEYSLIACGDTLLIDNWRMIHGRSAATASESTRRVERVYLDEIP